MPVGGGNGGRVKTLMSRKSDSIALKKEKGYAIVLLITSVNFSPIPEVDHGTGQLSKNQAVKII